MKRDRIGNLIRVDRRGARRNFNACNKVSICASNMRFEFAITVQKSEEVPDFDKVCNEYQYYNCGTETGRQLIFYVKEVN